MELQEFVTETLKQVISGVKGAEEHAAENGAEINPTRLTWSSGTVNIVRHNSNGAIVQNIEFDVVVTTTEGTTTKGGIGVFVGAVGLGSSGKSEAENSSMSRIKFSVPIILPM